MREIGKRGQVKSSTWTIIVIIIALVVVGIIVLAFVGGEVSSDVLKTETLEEIFNAEDNENTLDLSNRIENEGMGGAITFIFKYIFGMHHGILEDLQVNSLDELSIRGVMILIAVWVIFFLVFVDMSMLVMGWSNKAIGLLIGIAVAIIFANFGIYYWLIIWLIGVFAFLAGLSVIAALFSILVLGVGAHFGAGWVLRTLGTKRDTWRIASGGEITSAVIRADKERAKAYEGGE